MSPPLVITISSGIGSAGAYIGEQVACSLGILHLNRQILQEVARQCGLPEEVLIEREETLTPFWRSILESFSNAGPEWGAGVLPLNIPTDQELFALESAIIAHVAQEHSAVIVGRCGNFVLGTHPRHVSVFCHANDSFRLVKIRSRYHCSMDQAQEMIESNDHARSRYRKAMTGIDAAGARQYNLCMDTGVLGVEASLQLVLDYVKRRFAGC